MIIHTIDDDTTLTAIDLVESIAVPKGTGLVQVHANIHSGEYTVEYGGKKWSIHCTDTDAPFSPPDDEPTDHRAFINYDMLVDDLADAYLGSYGETPRTTIKKLAELKANATALNLHAQAGRIEGAIAGTTKRLKTTQGEMETALASITEACHMDVGLATQTCRYIVGMTASYLDDLDENSDEDVQADLRQLVTWSQRADQVLRDVENWQETDAGSVGWVPDVSPKEMHDAEMAERENLQIAEDARKFMNGQRDPAAEGEAAAALENDARNNAPTQDQLIDAADRILISFEKSGANVGEEDDAEAFRKGMYTALSQICTACQHNDMGLSGLLANIMQRAAQTPTDTQIGF